jgi:hypothetical protein
VQPLSQRLFDEIPLGMGVRSALGTHGRVYNKSLPESPTDFYVYIRWFSDSADSICHVSDLGQVTCL